MMLNHGTTSEARISTPVQILIVTPLLVVSGSKLNLSPREFAWNSQTRKKLGVIFRLYQSQQFSGDVYTLRATFSHSTVLRPGVVKLSFSDDFSGSKNYGRSFSGIPLNINCSLQTRAQGHWLSPLCPIHETDMLTQNPIRLAFFWVLDEPMATSDDSLRPQCNLLAFVVLRKSFRMCTEMTRTQPYESYSLSNWLLWLYKTLGHRPGGQTLHPSIPKFCRIAGVSTADLKT